ncbi:MAG: hypothetical protein J5585_08145 [Clostridia bacterium]|nr:hypothetical protein [Clostridia bacterium]
MDQPIVSPTPRPRFTPAAVMFTVAAVFALIDFLFCNIVLKGRSFMIFYFFAETFFAVALFIRVRNVVPFIASATLAFVSLVNLIRYFSATTSIFFIACTMLALFAAMTTFCKERTPAFFRKAWFIPGILLCVYLSVVLVYDTLNIVDFAKSSIDSDFFPKYLINISLIYVHDILLVPAFFLTSKWFVDTFTKPRTPAVQ